MGAADVWLVLAAVVALGAVLVLAFHRRLTPEGRGSGPLVAGALILLVLAVVLVAAILPER